MVCLYCRAIGACPKCWGRAGYDRLYIANAQLRAVAEAVLEWAGTPGEHGGNPYCKSMVQLARAALARGED